MFTLISTVIFGFLFLIWSMKSWANAILKFVFLTMLVFGIIESLHVFGYLVKI